MRIKKLSMLVILASVLATGTAIAQETDGSTDTEGTKTERQRPDRDQARQRRENMSDEDRQAARDKRQQRSGNREGQRARGQRGGKHPNGDRPQGDRRPKAESDAA